MRPIPTNCRIFLQIEANETSGRTDAVRLPFRVPRAFIARMEKGNPLILFTPAPSRMNNFYCRPRSHIHRPSVEEQHSVVP